MFDIDHLYLASFNYKKSEDGKTVSHDQFDPDSAEYHQNNILNQMMTLLKDTENSIHSLYKSIDNDTELLTDIADQIPEQGSNKARAYNFGSLHEQVTRRNDYITGKFGIGPYALNVTNQELTRCFKVSFKKTKFTEESGICNFDKLVDYQYNYISSWISAFINAHVDIVKDPYISKMNINQFTYNMSNLLIRSGFGESALWFLSQPIIRDMANASNSANSEFMRDPNKFKTVYSAQKEAVANAVLKWLSPEDVSESVISRYTTGDKNNTAEQLRVVNIIKSKMNVLKEIATHPGQKTVTVDGYIYDVANIQRDVFYAWKTLERYSIALGNLVQKTKIDTKKYGKSFLAIYKYRQDFNKLFYGDSEKSLWDEESLHRLAEESWIKSKTDYACSLPFVILKGQTFNGNSVFIHEITELYNQLNPEQESINIKKLEAISKAVQTQIKCKYIAKYAKEYLGKTDKQISELFVGKYSMAHRLNMLNTAIRTMDQYKRLADNMLIQQIYSAQEQEPVLVNGKRYERPSFIAIADRVGDSSMNSDMLIDAWQDLLLDEDKVVRQFARDLIVYAYMTSGEYAGWNNLFKYVPPAWIRGEIDTAYGESMASYVQNILSKNDFEKYIDLDELARNNFQDYTFSRRLAEKNADGERNILYNTDYALIIRTANDVKPPLYITTRVPGSRGNNASNFNIYKLVTPIGGVGEKNESTASMYIKIKKAGFDSGHKQKIYEYGWDFKYVENYSKNLSTIDIETMTRRLFGFISEHKNALPNKMYQEIIQSINDSKYDQQNDVVIPTVPVIKKESKLGYNSMSEIVMHSGGAYGADTAWDFYARKAGVKQINHYRDQRNQVLSSSLNKRGVKATVLSKEQMEFARRREFELLGKHYDDTLQGNLQVRNFYQVASSDGVFAIASMNSAKNGVSGGTNTAVQLGISLNKPTHVFDLNSEKWYKYNPESKVFEDESTPVLTKNFAGVGTRDIQKYNIYKDGKWVEREQYVGDDKSKVALKAIEDVFNKTYAELSNIETSTDNNSSYKNNTSNSTKTESFNALSISNKTETFGVHIDQNIIYNYKIWLNNNKDGIVAYRIHKNRFNTKQNVEDGIIGNPFDWRKYGTEKCLQMFADWLITGNNFGESLANGEYRSAIIDKLLSIDKPNILYYKELNMPSHATILGYLIEHKELLQTNVRSTQLTSTNKLPKNYTDALNQIQKWFDIDDQTTNITGKNNIKHAIQELHIEINDKYLISQMNEKDVLNLLYKTSKFLDEMQKLGNTGITIVSEDYFYGDFAKKVKHLTGETISDIENNYDIQEGEKEKTMEIPNPLIKILGFMESLNYKQREALDRIFEYPIYDLNPAVISSIDLSDKITITDTVEDTRQTDFLKELGMSDEDIKKAQEIKNHCKGGK